MKKILLTPLLLLSLQISSPADELSSNWNRIKENLSFEKLKERASDKVKDTLALDELQKKTQQIKDKLSVENLKHEASSKLKDSIYTKGRGGLLNDTLDIDDAKMKELADIAIKEYDSKNICAGKHNSYATRLNKLMTKISLLDKQKLDIQVYKSDRINAFSMANGAIRINSSLMDLMNDDELTFVIGHEVGHIVNTDSKDSYRLAYAISHLYTGKSLAPIIIEEITSYLVNAKFSRHEERDADAYAIKFIKHNKIPLKLVLGALEKLGNNSSNLLSTHPATDERIATLREAIKKGV